MTDELPDHEPLGNDSDGETDVATDTTERTDGLSSGDVSTPADAFRLPGLPPLPFEESTDVRGVPVYAVLEFGRPNEDPTVDRIFLDDEAAQVQRRRIEDDGLHATVLETWLE